MLVFIFSTLFSLHFLWYWQGEFVWQSGASHIGGRFLYSHDLFIWFMGKTARRNWKPVTLRGKSNKLKINDKVNRLFYVFTSPSAAQKQKPQRSKQMQQVDNLAELGSLTEVGLVRPKILLPILLTVCNAILIMWVRRTCHWINW